MEERKEWNNNKLANGGRGHRVRVSVCVDVGVGCEC
jgi:hypothetical protein